MYGRFSELYDRLVFDIDYDAYANKVQTALGSAAEGRILELGCGTGNLTCRLAPHVGEVFAVDASAEMLSIAWPKGQAFSNIHWSCQDLRALEAPPCDGAVALLDTMNYLTGEGDLLRALERIAAALRPGAPLLFDLNAPKRLLQQIATQTWVYEVDGIFYTWESQQEGALVHSRLNFFVRGADDRYERIEEEQCQRYYSKEEVAAALEQAGFADITWEDLEGGAVRDETERIFIRCAKKPARGKN